MKLWLVYLVTLALISTSVVFATEDNEDSTVTVTVSGQLWIDITPESMSWTESIVPGSLPSCLSTDTSCIGNSASGTGQNHNIYGIEIENIGSINITHIWLNTSMPTTNPFSTGLASNYDPGNFIAASFNNQSGFEFVNRVEYAMRRPIYLKIPAGVNESHTGRFRSGDNERFWALKPTNKECNETGTEFYITTGNVHNESQTGDIDLTDESAISVDRCAVEKSMGCANVTTSMNGENQLYQILVSADCKEVIFTRYNADLVAKGPKLYDSGYIFNDAVAGGPFTPGNYTPMYVEVRIPYGTEQGNLPTGYLRVYADDS